MNTNNTTGQSAVDEAVNKLSEHEEIITQKLPVRFGEWTVDSDGTLEYHGWYILYIERLTNTGLLEHLSEKSWLNWETFIPAYFTALTYAAV